MICDHCGHDRPEHRIRLLVLYHWGWPPIEFPMVCRDCRRDLVGGFADRVGLVLSAVVGLAVLSAAWFGICRLILWISQHVSTS